MRFRVVVEHLEELQPEGQKGKIDGVFMARLHRWSQILPNRGLEYWHTNFTDTYHGGLASKPSSVKMGRSKIGKMDSDEDKRQQAEFNQKVENLINKYMVEPSATEQSAEKAVNF